MRWKSNRYTRVIPLWMRISTLTHVVVTLYIREYVISVGIPKVNVYSFETKPSWVSSSATKGRRSDSIPLEDAVSFVDYLEVGEPPYSDASKSSLKAHREPKFDLSPIIQTLLRLHILPRPRLKY